MQARQNKYRYYRGFKVDEDLSRDKNASLGYTKEQIELHCSKVTVKEPNQLSNCLNLNFTAQKYYIDCYQALKNREECIRNLKFEVQQNGMYRLRYLKTD